MPIPSLLEAQEVLIENLEQQQMNQTQGSRTFSQRPRINKTDTRNSHMNLHTDGQKILEYLKTKKETTHKPLHQNYSKTRNVKFSAARGPADENDRKQKAKSFKQKLSTLEKKAEIFSPPVHFGHRPGFHKRNRTNAYQL